MSKKIIIIGGGIAGLTAGIYGLKANYDVEIYEKNHIVGGECTGWDRQGYYIDNCLHWMMGTNRGTDLYNIWKTVAAVGDDIEIFKSDIMYTSTLNGESLSLYRDLEKTRQEMIKLSKEDENEINELIKDVKIAMDVEIPAYKPMEFYGPIELLKMMRKAKKYL